VTVQLTHALMRDRAAYLGREAMFLIDPSNGSEARRFAGCITRFSRTPQPQDFCIDGIVIEPLLARRRLAWADRIYQRCTDKPR